MPPRKESTMQIDKTRCYDELGRQLTALIEGERDLIANSANVAALIFDALPDLNWAGFYFTRQNELVLGPFQGKPACIRIAWARAFAAPPPSAAPLSSCRTSINFRDTSPAIRRHARSWSCRFS